MSSKIFNFIKYDKLSDYGMYKLYPEFSKRDN